MVLSTLSPRVAPASHKSAVCAASSLAGFDGWGFPLAVAPASLDELLARPCSCDTCLPSHSFDERCALSSVSFDCDAVALAFASALGLGKPVGGRGGSGRASVAGVEVRLDTSCHLNNYELLVYSSFQHPCGAPLSVKFDCLAGMQAGLAGCVDRARAVAVSFGGFCKCIST